MTITRRTLENGTTIYSFTEADKAYLQAAQYQQRHGLSMTKAAIRARMKTFRRLQDQVDQDAQEGATGYEL